MIRIAAASRALTAVGLGGLLVFGIPRAPSPGEPLLVDAGTPGDTLAAIVAREGGSALTWIDTLPPTRQGAMLLASAARAGTEVTLALPDGAGRLRVEAPVRPMAGRRGALRVSVRDAPSADVIVTVAGPGGGVDTVSVATGPDGRGSTSVAVEPTRGGAASWVVRTSRASAAVHAWVRPAVPVRVLVWGDAPDAEDRFLVRALESAGMEVDVRQGLGRGLAVSSPGVSIPGSPEELAEYDVLALTGSPSDEVGTLVLRWVRERGGGLLLTGSVAGTSPLWPWAPRGPADEESAELEWAGPAEIVPLPVAEFLTRTRSVPAGGIPVARVGDRPVAALAHHGRGRLFTFGIESWPWVMRVGLGSEHQAFWGSVVEWLAGGLTEETVLMASPALVGARWEGHLEGRVPGEVILAGVLPDEDGEEILVTKGSADGTSRIAFVPMEEGGRKIGLRTDDGRDMPTDLGVAAIGPGQPSTWTSAALQIGTLGGRPVSTGDATDPLENTLGDGRSPERPAVWQWLLCVGLGVVAVTGWVARRVQGLP